MKNVILDDHFQFPLLPRMPAECGQISIIGLNEHN